MATLTAARDTPKWGEASRIQIVPFDVEANTTIYAGGLVVLNAAGRAVPATGNTTGKVVGRAEYTVANVAGVIDPSTALVGTGGAGARTIEVRRGVFKFDNATSGDLLALADTWANVYVIDDTTVGKTDGGATRTIAGRLIRVDTDGVWVEMG